MIYDNYTTTLGYIEFDNAEMSSSKLDAKDNQDLSIFNEVAVITIWLNDLNEKDKETFNEEEQNGEDLAKEDAIQNRINIK